jgi:hypothetical protein
MSIVSHATHITLSPALTETRQKEEITLQYQRKIQKGFRLIQKVLRTKDLQKCYIFLFVDFAVQIFIRLVKAGIAARGVDKASRYELLYIIF